MNRDECIYPGSFDPITSGHMDIIERAAKIFKRVNVAMLKNSAKKYMFSREKRLEMLLSATKRLHNVNVLEWDGLAADLARELKCPNIVRGVRSQTDFEFEYQASVINRSLFSEFETVFLPARPELICVSSSNVREMLAFGADVSGFVPVEILQFIKEGELK